jgi:hypothetical protein
MTHPTIVAMVVRPKIVATSTIAPTLDFAAGYMIKGMRGSQGPNTKIVKRTQGVSVSDVPRA